MRKFSVITGLLFAGLVAGSCDETALPRTDPPEASVVSVQESCAGCIPVARAAAVWFQEIEGISGRDIVFDLTESGHVSRRGPQVFNQGELSDLANAAGMQTGFVDDVLDCDDERILLNQRRCELRRGKVLLTLFAPKVTGSNAIMRLQRAGPGPEGSWWVAVYDLFLERIQGEWEVVGFELLYQS